MHLFSTRLPLHCKAGTCKLQSVNAVTLKTGTSRTTLTSADDDIIRVIRPCTVTCRLTTAPPHRLQASSGRGCPLCRQRHLSNIFRLPIPNPNPIPNPKINNNKNKTTLDTVMPVNFLGTGWVYKRPIIGTGKETHMDILAF